jgi:hypothetical protein
MGVSAVYLYVLPYHLRGSSLRSVVAHDRHTRYVGLRQS